ncbi:30S ribosomal protein S17 [Candidatus Kaiserbacteria bacterium RIFCSPHIGHO2_01_FULL_48_10]|uniref:Small ribosomal subunit protein uS17 n=1 Tax=Candidatus Kaiserbacteria bacterium RIFCSPHIGHO2_01_FULL_48_10 TaxID=1798476 RepID=A0A1F6C5L4_9BACT|nr:MAG: 30S ribosomal protein S17 [Candidatus Kaiserbacteria bacterium RIFCSPHIGHO2_01_FULL_48_10]
MEQKTVQQKTLVGTVVSTKAKDTITVSVSRYVKHPKYKKYIVTTKKFLAHDPGNTKKEGERVMIRSCRPISKRKHFIVV